MNKDDYIEIRFTREDIEVEFGYEFCNEKWSIFKEDTAFRLEEDLWDAFTNNLYNVYEDISDYKGEDYLNVSNKQFWTTTDKELKRQYKVKQLKEITIPNLFATKIQQFYLKAKYNPRTKIGKEFIYKLYHENFGEEE
tara:strand:- start:344 stop:757 length:414 start_codon:yes stop_codon:yes gene_type:complete